MPETVCMLPISAFIALVIAVLALMINKASRSEQGTNRRGPRGSVVPGEQTRAAARSVLPYRVRDDFVSAAELSLYHLVVDAAPDDNLVLAKVNLGDLFFIAEGTVGSRMGWRSRIDRKHVDLLLCDRRTLRPLLGIELDDRSHAREDRRQRDEFVDRVFRAAGLPLLRVPGRLAYNVQDLRAAIEGALKVSTEPAAASTTMAASAVTPAQATPAVAASEGEPPTCPHCGVPMVRRTAQRGPHAGEAFWGCPN
ncbi:MAG: DUF2726 domain-containing protein [Anaerolineae bacterium]